MAPSVASSGLHGVAILFVLSGYLITTRLLREERIDLTGFYLRRIFRFWPSDWASLLFVALIAANANIRTIGTDAWASLLSFRNTSFI
jgi:peptidoglycan/LPS O-acetylase OafA/YrhL